MATFLINQAHLTENTIVDGNVDYKKFKPALALAQDLDLLPILGSDLMAKLKTDVDAFYTSGTPVPEPYKTLLETYVQPALVHFALSRATPNFKFKYAAKGVIVNGSENSQSAETIDVEKQSDYWRNIGEDYAKRMFDYITFNTAVFPEYFSQIGTSYKIYPKRNIYSCPIFLGPSSGSNLVWPYNIKHINEG